MRREELFLPLTDLAAVLAAFFAVATLIPPH
jgi:hypothetical protein